MSELTQYTPIEIRTQIILPPWATLPQAKAFCQRVDRRLNDDDVHVRECRLVIGEFRLELVISAEFVHQELVSAFLADLDVAQGTYWADCEPADARATRLHREQQDQREMAAAMDKAGI